MSSSAPSRIIGLDILRCCAIFGVVGAHGLVFLYPHVHPFLIFGWTFNIGYLGHGGYYGVELFFALSGFLIGRILLRAGASLTAPREVLRFYARRWFRTLPAYALFLAVNLALITWVFPQTIPWTTIAHYFYFGQNLTALNTPFFGESWSLAVEEWFYLLFPVALLLLFRARFRSNATFLLAGLVFYLTSTWIRAHIADSGPFNWSDEPRRIVIARFDAMMVGIFAAWISLRAPEGFKRHRRWLALIGLASLLYTYIGLFAPDSAHPHGFSHILRFNLVSLSFALLLPWAQHFRTTGLVWLDTTIAHLACWSYAMYLSHMIFWRLLLERWLPDYTSNPIHAWVGFLLLFVLTITTSAIVYRTFERPCTNLRDRFKFSATAA